MKKKVLKVWAIAIMGVLFLSFCGSDQEAKTGNVIPDGCEFTVAEAGELYESGEPFPEMIQPGDELFDFEAGYEYVYATVPKIDSYLTEDGVEYVHLYEVQEDMAGWSVNVYDSEIESCGELRSEINGISVVNIDYCYCGCDKIKDFSEIPNTIISMNGTFGRCSLLEEMPKLPEGLISMKGTFEGCGITAVSNISTTVKDMSGAFMLCTELKEVGNIPNGVENMQDTFNRCTALETVGIIPESVTDMSYCFTGCKNLTGDLFIYAAPKYYEKCFYGTEKKIFVYGSETSDWSVLDDLCKTVESGWFDNVVMPG